MACPACRRRSELIAALAPAISGLRPLTRHSLLGLLSLREPQLLRATGIEDPSGALRELSGRAHTSLAGRHVPTAICRHERDDYPAALAQLDSAPAVLYATCTIERLRALLAAPTVALVGPRTPSSYAHQRMFALARDLARAGVTILGGLNDGLEGVAHEGALRTRGRSIAVLPCTPDTPPFPHSNGRLHRDILARGAAVAEFPPGLHPPRRWCFTASQRILAALATVLVVVEAAPRSSALFAAHIAAELGRDVAVVPGRVTDPGGLGVYALLRDGAHPVACARDVLDLIG